MNLKSMNLNIPKGVLTGDDVQNVFKLAKRPSTRVNTRRAIPRTCKVSKLLWLITLSIIT